MQDFVSSVSTLLTVRKHTENLRERIQTLDSSVSSVGGSFASRKKNLLASKKTAANLDETIDTLQACLRVLDLVNRVGDMIREEKYWSALKVCLPFLLLSEADQCSRLLRISNRFRSPPYRSRRSSCTCYPPSHHSGHKSKTLSPPRTIPGYSRYGIPVDWLANWPSRL